MRRYSVHPFRHFLLLAAVSLAGCPAASSDNMNMGASDLSAAAGDLSGASHDLSGVTQDMKADTRDLTGVTFDLTGVTFDPAGNKNDLAAVPVDLAGSSSPDLASGRSPDLASGGSCNAVAVACTGAAFDPNTGLPLQGSCCSGLRCFGMPPATTGACCAGPGDACTATADCCGMGGTCTGGTCQFNFMCLPTGSACGSTDFCCAAICTTVQGAPVSQPGQTGSCCTGNLLDNCTTNADCCSNNCVNGMCRQYCGHTGATCTQSSDCCTGNYCNSGQCQVLCTITQFMACTPGGACCANHRTCQADALRGGYTCQ